MTRTGLAKQVLGWDMHILPSADDRLARCRTFKRLRAAEHGDRIMG